MSVRYRSVMGCGLLAGFIIVLAAPAGDVLPVS
jgi:hypothetical protein